MHSKSKVLTFKVPQDQKLRREWLIKMKRECFMPSKHSRVCAKHKRAKRFTEDSFEQNLVVRSLLGPSFKLRQLVEKKDVVPTIFNFSMERCKPANAQKKNNETQVNNAHRTAGESSAISAFLKTQHIGRH